MVIDLSFSTFGNLFAQLARKDNLHIVNPAARLSCPLLYSAHLRLCALLLSFETADWCSVCICCNFCSRE